ncbi:ketoacyl-ACP synthase III [Kitasatospora putterlickiae]|uniref:Ketoacyl-ACP synthase III n=1 Tax=Kitasatospora putterlickiae TaxID=221725 RepID=A0ABP4ISJ0_9ACTN
MSAGPVPIGVLGTGTYLPPTVVTNEEIAALTGTSARWIEERTGIRRRRRALPGQASSDLAAAAVQAALTDARLDVGDLDLVVLATSTPDELGPSTACRVQSLLGADRAVAFDVSAACSGWLFGARVAVDWLRAETGARYAAVVGVETYSPFVDASDRATAVLFGDGAAATVLGPVATGGFGRIRLGSDGTRADQVLIPAGGSRIPATGRTVAGKDHRIHMQGRQLASFVNGVFPSLIGSALDDAALGLSDIDLVVAHQPNPAMLRDVARRCGVLPRQLVVAGRDVGNIGAASMPFALAQAARAGRTTPGARVLTLAFGAGLTWGSTVLTWAAPAATAPGGPVAAQRPLEAPIPRATP